MKLLGVNVHPRRAYRRLRCFCYNLPFLLQCRIRHVDYVIGENSLLKGCSVETKLKDGKLVIGDNCLIKNTIFGFYGIGGKVVVKNYVHINARPEAKTKLCVKDNTSIVIDDDCLFSNAIDISTTDWHSVIDEQGERINHEKDVYIGKHVWIGRKVIIGKGVIISENSIVGAGSVVTKQFTECNVIIAGDPAKVRKSNVNWE